MTQHLIAAGFVAMSAVVSVPALAQFVDHDKVRCEAVAKEEMRPQMELQRKLTDAGWKVRQIRTSTAATRSTASTKKASVSRPFSIPRPSRRSAR